jgi:hypothetical protein
MMNSKMKDKMGRAMPKRGDMSDKMGRAMAGMKSGGDVKKMQMGGRTPLSAEQRAANRAANAAKRQAGFDARMAAARERNAPRKAASAAFKERIAAARARRGGMKSGGSVKKYAEGGSVYRKAADGVAHKGKTKAKMVKMAMGGKC